MDKTRILIIAANPQDTKELAVNEEYREIEKILDASRQRENFELKFAPAAQISDLKQKLLDFEPHIVHFSGHGEFEGLRFQNDNRSSQIIHQDPLEELFRLFSYCLDGIILNACNSEQQAQRYVKHINWVIGMSKAIDDKAAILFAQDFYRALFSGKDVDFAFNLGKNAIDTANLKDWEVPQLKKRGEQQPQSVSSALPFLANYADDVLIHAATADAAFAESFKTELQKHVAAKLGSLDKFRLRLQTDNQDFSQAATVIILLSAHYVQHYGEQFQNLIQLKEKRLLLVEINKTEKPASLAEVVEYTFWQKIRQNTLTYQSTDSVYQSLMAEIVVELNELLQHLKTHQSFQNSNNKVKVFINVAPEDRDLGEEVGKLLKEKYRLSCVLPATTGTCTDIENKYRYCQAILFIYLKSSDEWVDLQLLACDQALNEHQKDFKIIAIHTNQQKIRHINANLLSLQLEEYFCPPETVDGYLPRFVEALK